MHATLPSPACSPASPTSNAAWPTAPDPALIRGIAAYRRHPWHRTLPDPPAIWTEGAARLLDYGAPTDPAMLFVPSLVNRAYILDLMPGQSLLRWLAGRGVRPLLLDWGWPGPDDRTLTLSGTVERLGRAIDAVGTSPILAGYCMGGLLATAAALDHPHQVRALALLATPWDFHAEPADAGRLAAILPRLEPLMALSGTLPVDAIQTLFAAVEPGAIARKFRAFGILDQASDAAARFVAIEDWLNDGVPLAAPITRETLGQWYGANAPARGTWSVAGRTIDPARLAMPCFAAIPGRDRIVPPASALALATAIPDATIHRPAAGHIGMAAGPRAQAELWEPMLAWLRAL